MSIAYGDSFTMLVDNVQIRIRLHGIDCLKRRQDFSNVAREFLSDYVYDRVVVVEEMDIVRYGRTIGMVTVEGVNVNEALLEAGLAWHFTRYDDNPNWARLEASARRAGRGLWARPNPIPPWEWRNRNR